MTFPIVARVQVSMYLRRKRRTLLFESHFKNKKVRLIRRKIQYLQINLSVGPRGQSEVEIKFQNC